MNSFYSNDELDEIGFEFGENVLVSKKVSFYDVKNIKIGSNVRIDDFCIISGNVTIGSFVHISAFCAFYGSEGIEVGDYSGTSPRVTIFSASDDFSGNAMIGPMVNQELTNVQKGKVILERFVQVGAGSIVMPGVNISEGAVVGAMSFVKEDLEQWTINAGVPSKFIKKRKVIKDQKP